ncbi:MAG: ABC transporter permease [Gammaproteobacteria bacterium]|nr:ABC transporter permease [Gammaproteobacteria bacterium]
MGFCSGTNYDKIAGLADRVLFSMFGGYLEVVVYKTYADLRAETERTYLGFLWWIFEPIMYMAVFYVVFGLALNRGTEGFVPFLLIGLTVWQWMKSCFSHGSESILNNRALMQHVHLPKIIFPTVAIMTNTVKFVFIFLLLLIYLWFSGYTIGLPYLALPFLLLLELTFTVAITYIMAAAVPFFPDIRFIIENFLQAVFFMSGVFFTVSAIPAQYRDYFYLNPMAVLIEAYRDILMHNQWPDWKLLAIIAAGSLLGAVLGVYLIARFEYAYPKITL